MWMYGPSRTDPLPTDPFARKVLTWLYLTLAMYGGIGPFLGWGIYQQGSLSRWVWFLFIVAPPVLGYVLIPVLDSIAGYCYSLVFRPTQNPINVLYSAPLTGASLWIERVLLGLVWGVMLSPFAVEAYIIKWRIARTTISIDDGIYRLVWSVVLWTMMPGVAGVAASVGAAMIYGVKSVDRHTPEWGLRRARQLMNRERWDEAWAELESLRNEFPKNPEVLQAIMEEERREKA